MPAPGGSALGGCAWSWGGLLPGGCLLLGGRLLPGGVPGGAPTPGTATAAGGTHPTAMHSCFRSNLHI